MSQIIEKMMQLQALTPLVDQLRTDIDYIMEDIETDGYGYHGYGFRELKDGIVHFYAYNSYSCGTDTYDYEMPIAEFNDLIAGKTKLKYK